jgi:hypothetical protein
LLLGIDLCRLCLSLACLLLEPNRLFGCGNTFTLSALLIVLSGGFLRVALAFCGRFLTACLRLGLTLGVLTLSLDALLALARRNLVLETVVLKLRLGLLCLKRRFCRVTVRFGRGATCLGLGVNRCLLQATLAGQVVVAKHGAGRFLRLTGNLADQPTGGPLGILLISHCYLFQ